MARLRGLHAYDWARLREREELLAIGRDLAAEVKRDDVPSLAAAVAFKIVLALFPALLTALAITGLVVSDAAVTELVSRVGDILPEDATTFLLDQVIRPLTKASTAGVALVISVALGLNSATAAAVTLDRALTRAYDLSETRPLIAARVNALFVTSALFLALILMFVVLVAFGPLEDSVLRSLGLSGVALSVADFAATVGRYIVVLVLLMLLFAFIYWVGPNFDERPPYPWISPGALVGVVLWLVGSGLFAVYVDNFGSFTGDGSIYGTLGSAIVFMLWLQLSMLVLLLGAELNQVIRLRTRQAHESAQMAGFGGDPAQALAPPAPPLGRSDVASTPDTAARPLDTPVRPSTTAARPPDLGLSNPADASTGAAAADEDAGPRPTVRRRRIETTAAIVAGVAALAGVIGLLRGRRDA